MYTLARRPDDNDDIDDDWDDASQKVAHSPDVDDDDDDDDNVDDDDDRQGEDQTMDWHPLRKGSMAPQRNQLTHPWDGWQITNKRVNSRV